MKENMNYQNFLQENDDQTNYEYPKDFSLEKSELKFNQFAQKLQLSLKYDLNISSGACIQDASFHGEIMFRTKKGTVLVRCSNFARMVNIDIEDNLEKQELELALMIIREFDYIHIPSSELKTRYVESSSEPIGIENWGHRYFDYL